MMKLSTTMVVGGLGAAAVLFLLLKPKDAAAATTPKPTPTPAAKKTCPDGVTKVDDLAQCPAPIPTLKKCPDGSSVDPSKGQTCPVAPNGCTATPNVPYSGTMPHIELVISGDGPPTGQLPVPFGLTGLPLVNTTEPCVTGANDALVFIQSWDMASGYQPVFIDPNGVATAVGIVLSDATGTGVSKAANYDRMVASNDSFISAYFDPAQNTSLAKMDANGSFVLVWTTDIKGAPIRWWLTTWSAQ